MKQISILLIILSVLVVACRKEPPRVGAGPRLVNLIEALPSQNEGWEFRRQSGGGSSYGQSRRCSIELKKGKLAGDAVRGLQALIVKALKSENFRTVGSGQSHSGGELVGFSITVADSDSVGTIAVSVAEVNENKLIAAIAVSQIGSGSGKAE